MVLFQMQLAYFYYLVLQSYKIAELQPFWISINSK